MSAPIYIFCLFDDGDWEEDGRNGKAVVAVYVYLLFRGFTFTLIQIAEGCGMF